MTKLIIQEKAIVKKYEVNFNGGIVYAELMNYLTKSTRSLITATELLIYLTYSRLADCSWKGSTQDFILNWFDKVRKH